MDTIIIAIIIVIIIIAVFAAISRSSKEIYPYHKKYLLTKNEYYFYKKLENATAPFGYQILAKIRLADLIEVDSGIENWHRYFSKISSKHIDFAIADHMKVILLIELDDSSHQRPDRQERDVFVNNALEKAGYTLIRTNGELDEIVKALRSASRRG